MTDSKIFGKMLKDYREKNKISLKELSELISASEKRISEWESGAKLPNFDYAYKLTKALKLNKTEILAFLNFAGHIPSPKYVYRPSGIVLDNPVIVPQNTIDLDLIEQSVKSLDNLDSKIISHPSSNNDEQKEILDEIQKITDNLSKIKGSDTSLSAPVILPPTEDMEIRLVSSTSLERLEEYRSEESKWYAVTGIFSGAILGILSNIVTGGVMTNSAWLLFGFCLVILIFAGLNTRKYKKQGKKIKEQIFKN